jgi:hypothetical protein
MFQPRFTVAFVAAVVLSLPAPGWSASRIAPATDRIALDQALAREPDSPSLNFLSGLLYDATAIRSTESRELARVGYRMALRQDNSFWPAEYQLGLAALEDRDLLAAQRHLLSAARLAPREARVFLALARAAFCAGDYPLAAAALARGQELGGATSPDAQVTQALVLAAQGETVAAEKVLLSVPAAAALDLRRRLEVGFSSSLATLAAPTPVVAVPASTGITAAPTTTLAAAEGNMKKPRMALIDVVIIRRSETRSQRTGINLLDALTLQFGSTLLNRTASRTVDQLTGGPSTDSTTRASETLLTIPAITYSLNIANALGNQSTIEARPTLLATDGMVSKVFNGGTLTYATDGQISSSSYTRDVGLTLSVKPKFAADDLVSLEVSVVMENFVSTPPVGSFRQAVQTEKSSTDVTAEMRFGQTLLVSSGTSDSRTESSSRVPLAGNLPLVGRLFRSANASKQFTELLVLLSLRRVEGSAGSSSASSETGQLESLRSRVFPGLVASTQGNVENSRSFYRLDNPAITLDADYLKALGLAFPRKD